MILIADDQSTNRTLLVRLLNMLGHVAESAVDGHEALAKWTTGQFKLLITDCQMPGLDGYALACRIRAIETEKGLPRAPLYAWTSAPTREEHARITAAGMDGVLTKPVELEALKLLLQLHLPVDHGRTLPPAEHSPSSAPPTAPLDKSVMLRYSGGNPDIEREIIAEFDVSSHAEIDSIRRSLAHHDLALLVQCCHRLKGASRMIGADGLAAACAMMELSGSREDWDGIRAQQDELFNQWRVLRDMLNLR